MPGFALAASSSADSWSPTQSGSLAWMSSPRAAWMLVSDLGDGDHDDEDQERKPNEQEENLQRRGVSDLWPPGERFQRH